MYGPALLFHQQYPTMMCGKVTTRTAPADTVPTVTDWQLEPCGNGDIGQHQAETGLAGWEGEHMSTLEKPPSLPCARLCWCPRYT